MNENNQEGAPEISGKFALWMILALWVLVFVFLTVWASRWFEQRTAPQQAVSATDPSGRLTVQLQADPQGHYLVNGRVNGKTVAFLVDTGASSVALPEAVAKQLRLTSGYPVTTSTANGSATAYRVVIDSIELGSLKRESVEALITPGLEGKVALLGMSFLRHFELIQKDGSLTLREP